MSLFKRFTNLARGKAKVLRRQWDDPGTEPQVDLEPDPSPAVRPSTPQRPVETDPAPAADPPPDSDEPPKPKKKRL